MRVQVPLSGAASRSWSVWILSTDKTVIFPFTEGYFNNDEIPRYIEQFPEAHTVLPSQSGRSRKWWMSERCHAGFKGLLHPQLCGFYLSNKALADPILR